MATTKSIRGTETEKNLVVAYLAESAAYTRYTFYAQQAEKELYYPVAEIFRQTADNELHHGKIFFKFLEGGQVTVPMTADAGVIGDTASNLTCAAHEELVEGVDLYTRSAEVADKEGFPEIASHFRAIAEIEHRHRLRFERYERQVKEGTVWKREKPIKWQCLVCGFIYEGTTPPTTCPGCSHPYQHYMALDIADL